MSNHFFQFKQFRIEQEFCAMKVSTDACIQGAWTPIFPEVKNVLDVGTGTGLLGLMLAQRNEQLLIDAIEIDEGAFLQAARNFEASLWKKRLQIFQGDARHFELQIKYDLIICNPPFFQNSILGTKRDRNYARHQLSLNFDELFFILEKNLIDNGYVSVIFPITEYRLWKELLVSNNWCVFKELKIVPAINKIENRIVSLCCRNSKTIVDEESLCIRDENNQYSIEYSKLLSPFYL